MEEDRKEIMQEQKERESGIGVSDWAVP